MTKKINTLIAMVFAATLTGCGNNFESTYSEISKETVDKLACEDFETTFWGGLKEFIIRHDVMPEAEIISEYLEQHIMLIKNKRPDLTENQLKVLSKSFFDLVDFVFTEGRAVSATPQEVLALISAIDFGDRSTIFREYMLQETQAKISSLKAYIHTLSLNCDSEVLPEEPFDFETSPGSAFDAKNMTVWGGRFALATAYQSCHSIDSKGMDESSDAVRGIAITGQHPDGIGSKREIASLSDVVRTHFYIRDVNSYPKQCHDLRSNPLIYDYGGKPYVTTAASSPIDFFRDAGSGTKVLGIDCSGFVFSALATAGLKVASGRALKASDAHAFSSRSFKDPEKNNMTCLGKIAVGSQGDLLAGDIAAVNGHVFIVDSVGSDPLNLDGRNQLSQCENIDPLLFDFTVIQSSNSKGGIGINRYVGKDYLQTSPKFLEGFLAYAKQACLARIQGKMVVPQISIMSLIRHKGGVACMAKRIPLVKEECVQSCSL